MQDVIFAGTETRKPQGFAYVAITLDNADHKLPIDYEEVTVSRRLYRSGESEYLINGASCRLKDINELFYDTGIGKEGYSIIGQGQIDKILSGKPEERRELFDEAAGIVKFKRRKAMAQKNLEDEKQNLVRVTDILAELEKQVGPLKRQSEAAREYLRLREELRVKDANLFLLESDAVRGQMQETEQKTQIVTEDLKRQKEAQEELKCQYEAYEQQILCLDQAIQESRQKRQDSIVEKNSLEGQVNVLKEQIHTEQLREEHIRERMETIGKECAQKQAQQQEVREKESRLSLELSEAQQVLQEAQEALSAHDGEVSGLEKSVEDDKAKMMEILTMKSSLNARQQRYEAMLEQVQVRRAEVSQKLLRFKTEEVNQDMEIGGQQKRLDAIADEIREILEERETVEAILSELEEETRRLSGNLNEAQQRYHTSVTRLESLKNIAERYEGYGNSIRRVMEMKDRVHGIHGVVADLIATEKKYETAIETALGGSIQNIVTDSEETAKQLIAYLKKNKYGRATFLPLTSIGNRNAFSQTAVLREVGVLGLAHTLVKADRQYDGLLQYLLGRVVVVDTIDHAVELARKFQYTLRIVTLEGELLSPGGSMTGGAFKNSSNLLGRRREIEELETMCKKALEETKSIQKDLKLHSELSAVQKEELEEVKKKEQAAYLEQNTAQIGMDQLKRKKDEILENASDLVRENGQLEDQIREIRESREALAEEIRGMNARNAQLQEEIAGWGNRLDEKRSARTKLADQVSAAQLAVARLVQSGEFLRENEARIQEEMQRLLEEKESLSHGDENAGEAIAQKEQAIADILLKIQAGEAQKTQLDEQIQKQEQDREQKATQQKQVLSHRDSLTEQVNGLDKEIFRLESQKEKQQEKFDTLARYMWNEYELTTQTAQELRNEEWSGVPALRQEVDELKGKIRRLGNVNVHAIDDYQEISERYTFMKTQHDDLVQAEEALLRVIEELDTGMRKQFEEKFGEIRREFDKVFKELFGGGHGELELMEGDILETGIQIISQPPGKKLQNMMQLSGGEKALTAIALLFAIQNLKPSPFCLLDEIEAALDDSNVDRFAKYLHKLTKSTQFIVITHRRGTMVSADRLYGITMQEKGVSTLVSVSLIEDELEDKRRA